MDVLYCVYYNGCVIMILLMTWLYYNVVIIHYTRQILSTKDRVKQIPHDFMHNSHPEHNLSIKD